MSSSWSHILVTFKLMLSHKSTIFLLCCFLVAFVQAQHQVVNGTTEFIGIWYWTWSDWAKSPQGTNIGVAFNGYADPNTALAESWNTYDKLPGQKWISLGGGDSDGRFTWNILTEINNAINSGKFGAYHGIVFDVEEGDSGLYPAFAQAFQSCKNHGIDVMVTVSHSAPYGFSDAASLMNSFFHDGNIHFLSPQLYTTGEESGNDFSTTEGVQWSSYASWNTKALVVPSIVKADYYWDAAGYLSTQGVNTQGYMQWSQY